jgi:hypothetical protein
VFVIPLCVFNADLRNLTVHTHFKISVTIFKLFEKIWSERNVWTGWWLLNLILDLILEFMITLEILVNTLVYIKFIQFRKVSMREAC